MHSYEPCMCGDPACGSCGPAQGFSRCEAHGVMACDSCVAAGDAELPTAPEGGERVTMTIDVDALNAAPAVQCIRCNAPCSECATPTQKGAAK